MTRFLFERQQLPDGSMPRNSLANGKPAPDSFNTQLDECAYPLVMALAVGLTGQVATTRTTSSRPRTSWPATGRRSAPSAGRSRAASRPRRSRPRSPACSPRRRSPTATATRASAAVWRGVADEFQRNLKAWTLTTNGPLGDGRYFIRLSKTGDPNAAISYGVGNGGPTLDQRSVIDAGFLEYTRLGLLADNDPDIVRSLPIVDSQIRRSTDSGVGFFRYNGDGYGDRLSDGRPWAPTPATRAAATCGRCWPASAASTRSTAAWPARRSRACEAMRNMSSGVGLIPEQAWEAARPRRLAVRDAPERGVDRLRERQAGRLGVGADVVRRPVRPADARHRGGPHPRPPALHDQPLRAQHAGPHGADGDRADRSHDRRQPGDGDAGPRRPATRSGSRRPTRTRTATTSIVSGDGRLRRVVLDPRAADRRPLGAQHRGDEPLGRDRARGADGRGARRQRAA